MYYFSKFIQWPDNKSENTRDFVVGVYGDTEVFSEVANAMIGRKIEGQEVVVKRFSTVSQIKDCHVLYIAPNKSSNFYRAEDILKGKHTLIVTQKQGLGKKGSHINLTIQNGKMKFELNKSSIAKTGLKVSGTLISQAIVIK